MTLIDSDYRAALLKPEFCEGTLLTCFTNCFGYFQIDYCTTVEVYVFQIFWVIV